MDTIPTSLQNPNRLYYLPIWWPEFCDDGQARCACQNPDCTSIAKHPIGDLTPNGLLDSTNDEATIASWYAAYPKMNIAIDLAKSDLCAFDVDLYHGDDQKLQALMAEHGWLPDTMEQRSGSGQGVHLIFRRPAFPLRGQLNGLVIRGRNYIVSAPSLHKSGKRYEWEAGRGPEEIPPANLPEKWLAALRKPDPLGDVGLPPESGEPPWLQVITQEDRIAGMRLHLAKEKGERKGIDRPGMTWDVIRTCVRAYAIRSPGEVLSALLEIYNPKCIPPYSEEGLVDRIWKAYENAHSPVWGSELEPVANVISAFWAQFGITPATAEPTEDVIGAIRTCAKSLANARGTTDAAIERARQGKVLLGILKREPIIEANAVVDAVRLVVRFAPKAATSHQLSEILIGSFCHDPQLTEVAPVRWTVRGL